MSSRPTLRRSLWSALFVMLLALSASFAPASAQTSNVPSANPAPAAPGQTTPGGTTPGGTLPAAPPANEVLTVFPDAPPAPLYDESTLNTIATLQNVSYPALLSPISPDGEVALAGVGFELLLLNVLDGSTVAVSPNLFRFGPISDYVWRDADTLEVLAYNVESFVPELVRVLIDRADGSISVELLDVPLPGTPLAVSPDLNKVLILFVPEAPLRQGEVEASGVEAIRGRAPMTETVSLTEGFGPSRELPWAEKLAAAYPVPGKASGLFHPASGDDQAVLQVTAEQSELAVLDLAAPSLTPLASLPPGTFLASAFWQPDGEQIALVYAGFFEQDEVRPFYDGALISSLTYKDVTGQLPPEENPVYQNNQITIFDLASGESQTLRPADDSDAGDDGTTFNGVADWAPDGATWVAGFNYPSQPEGRTYPSYLFAKQSGLRFYSGTQPVDELVVQTWGLFPDARFISPSDVLIQTVEATNYTAYRYAVGGGEPVLLNPAPGISYQGRLTPALDQFVFSYMSWTQPPEIVRLDLNSGELLPLTGVNAAASEAAAARAEPVSFTLVNGTTREGYLILPASMAFPPQNVPLVVWQEGGPINPIFAQYGANVENPFALLPTFGYPLLVMPLPGRDGYGPEQLEALADGRNFGQIDIDEQAEISQQMIFRGWTSEDKLGITGCSYGGYFTTQSIARHPDLYAAANAQCSLIDLVVEWTRGYQEFLPYLEGPINPYEHTEEFLQDSPAYNVDSMKTPLLLFKGTFDFLPIVLDENMHAQLVEQGVDSRFVKFAFEGHGLGIPSNQLYAAQEQLRWFQYYLGSNGGAVADGDVIDADRNGIPDAQQRDVWLPLVTQGE